MFSEPKVLQISETISVKTNDISKKQTKYLSKNILGKFALMGWAAGERTGHVRARARTHFTTVAPDRLADAGLTCFGGLIQQVPLTGAIMGTISVA